MCVDIYVYIYVCVYMWLCRRAIRVDSIFPIILGQPSVGLRMPNHPVALALIRLSGVPIAAPSANKSGRPSPTTADHVLTDLCDGIKGVVDGGACGIGVESTVVDCTDPRSDTVTILRPGGVSKEQLQTIIPNVLLDPAIEQWGRQSNARQSPDASSHFLHSQSEYVSKPAESISSDSLVPRAPGMKYTHYAPRAPVRIVDGPISLFQQAIFSLSARGEKVGVMCSVEHIPVLQDGASYTFACGHNDDLDSVARDLYATLRKFDETDVTIILAESFSTSYIGHAVMNRLSKSAGHHIVRCIEDLGKV